jgi:hypothetical protein
MGLEGFLTVDISIPCATIYKPHRFRMAWILHRSEDIPWMAQNGDPMSTPNPRPRNWPPPVNEPIGIERAYASGRANLVRKTGVR